MTDASCPRVCMREHVPWVQGSLLLDALERGGVKWGCGHSPGWRWGYFCLDNRCGYRHMVSCQLPGLRPGTQASPPVLMGQPGVSVLERGRPAWPTRDEVGWPLREQEGSTHQRPAHLTCHLPHCPQRPLPMSPKPQAQSQRLLVVTFPVATSASLPL